jgi:hypothetical protein
MPPAGEGSTEGQRAEREDGPGEECERSDDAERLEFPR